MLVFLATARELFGNFIPFLHVGINNLTADETADGWGFFDQLIEHNDPSKGTFKQKFWFSIEYWGGPGSPVILVTPGEAAANPENGYLDNSTLCGRVAQEINGAILLVERELQMCKTRWMC